MSAVPPPLTPVETALARLLAACAPVGGAERVAAAAAPGRVLAADVTARLDVPPFAASAMDGYAVRRADLDAGGPALELGQRIAAGRTAAPLGPGRAARVFTGAPVPPGADAVVIQEHAEEAGGRVRILKAPAPGENLRAAGEDVRAGATLLRAGHRLRAADAGLLAAAGVAAVRVARRLRVALLAAGDELVPPGAEPGPGQVVGANAPALAALLAGPGVEVRDRGIVGDSLPAAAAALSAAAAEADALVSTGGVSVGEEDHMRAALAAAGTLELWRLAIKPGKPFASGRLGACRFFGLPGNPASAFVTCLVLVRPCLLAMQGAARLEPPRFPVPAAFSRPAGDRQEYLRVRLERTEDGLRLAAHPNQRPGALASLSAADGLAIIPPRTRVAPGRRLDYLPFSGLLD